MQRVLFKISSAVAVSCLSATFAFAQGHVVKVTVDCPDIGTKGTEIVTNYGTYLAGPGIEKVNSDAPTQPLFQGPVLPGANIPKDLKGSGYVQSGVTYNPFDGAVICQYVSQMGFDPFSVSYLMANALNGKVVSSGVDEIHIRLPVGLIK